MKKDHLIVLALLAMSCTKETYVEGLNPSIKSFTLSKTLPLYNGAAIQLPLKVEDKTEIVSVGVQRYKSTTANAQYGLAAGDSVLYVFLSSSCPIQVKGSSVNKYKAKETMNASGDYMASSIPLLFAVKKTPYTQDFITTGKMGNATLNFVPNDDGYFSFKTSTTSGTVPVYGWIHLSTDGKNIAFDKYGYQTFDVGEAGRE